MPESTAVVEVLYALPDAQIAVHVDFTPGLTVSGAVERSGLLQRFPEIAAHELVLGVWGVGTRNDEPVQPGDRVEISRPLLADPRDMRRDLMSGGRVMGGAEALSPKVRK